MLTNAKINLKKYISFTLILLLLTTPLLRSKQEIMVVIIVVLASCINQWMLVYIVRKMTESAANQTQKNNSLISLMTIAKLLIVVGALSFGVQIMGKRIIIPVLIYVLQIVVLYLSFEKQTSVEKGS